MKFTKKLLFVKFKNSQFIKKFDNFRRSFTVDIDNQPFNSTAHAHQL